MEFLKAGGEIASVREVHKKNYTRIRRFMMCVIREGSLSYSTVILKFDVWGCDIGPQV